MPASTDKNATATSTDKATDVIVDWIETNVGGRVTTVDRQPRWRPTWFVDVEHDGAVLPLCVRGARSDSVLTFPLEHEMRFLKVLQDHDMPVPALHGWIDALPAIVMDRAPGRPDTKDLPDADRDRIVREYFAALARVHRIPVEALAAAGIERAATPAESGWYGLGKMIDVLFHGQKQHPDPFAEWTVGWIRRHPPRSQGREAAVVWDSGQLHHDDRRFVSLIDLELGHVGDPMMDLAGLRMRDSVIPFGDFEQVYANYERDGGWPVDIEAIELHHIAFTISNELGFSHTLREYVPGSDFATNMQWCNETNIYVTEAIADYLGADLPEVDVPAASGSRTAVASTHLARTLQSVEVDDPVLRYRLRGAFRVAQHLARYDEIGEAITAEDLDDLAGILGHRPGTWHEGEAALEAFVLADAATGEHDARLLPFFHRRNLRAQMLNGPQGGAMARHNPIQRFPKGPRPGR